MQYALMLLYILSKSIIAWLNTEYTEKGYTGPISYTGPLFD